MSSVTSWPAVALAWLVSASVFWFWPSSAIDTSLRMWVRNSRYTSAEPALPAASTMVMEESSGMTATASWIMASSMSSRRSVASSSLLRGCLPTSQGVPYFSRNRNQKSMPPCLNLVAQKVRARSARP